MKKLRMALLAGLLIAAVCVPAHAWEFAMTGNFEWTYIYAAQGGDNGFFGPKDFSNDALSDTAPFAAFGSATTVNWHALNFWAGARKLSGTQFGLVTGDDASMQYMKMVMNPEIRVNPAIRIRGQYWIGSFNNWSGGAPGTGIDLGALTWAPSLGVNTDMGSGFYLNQQTGSAITRPIATGQWNLLWVTAQTPWGILVFGKRPAPFGMGLGSDGERTVCSESLTVVAPYGPLRIGVYAYPWRQGVFLDHFRNINFGSSSASVPSAAVGRFVNNTTGTRYPKFWDASGIRLQLPQVGAFVTYSDGPLETGIIYEYFQQHQGVEHSPMTRVGNVAAGSIQLRRNMPTVDQSIEDGIAYVKYNNGRFFFNAELDWCRFLARFQPGRINFDPAQVDARGTGAGSVYQPVATEAWMFGTEFGFLCGPSKLSFLYAHQPGPDRRDGFWISNSAWENIAFGNVSCNGPLTTPYSYLLAYTYSSGMANGFVDGMGGGGMTAATSVGTRLDYAVAANLNWYGTFFWAWREGGWPVGLLTINPGFTPVPTFGAPGVSIVTTLGANSVDMFGLSSTEAYPATAARGVPNIPDNNLGWEFTSGVDWKLLEGLTMNLRGAFWQPGEWFKFACVQKSIANTVTGSGRISPLGANTTILSALDGTPLAVNPAKSIDGIWAFQGQLNVDF